MIDTAAVREKLVAAGMSAWAEIVESQLAERLQHKPHGDMPQWQSALARIPALPASALSLDSGLIQVGAKPDSSAQQREQLTEALQCLHPWRKGPFLLHGTFVDTEWRSDWKWDRLAPHIASLNGRKVLDVGCGNGYHCWRMAGAGAELAIGIDPTQLYLMQFLAVQRLVQAAPSAPAGRVMHLPLGIEHLPPGLGAFDTVFSMGVLYHRRSPLDHLVELRDALRRGGELVLETLVIDGDAQQVLMPRGRYAKMRNVWFIPSVAMLELWMQRCGFRHVRCVDVTSTTVEEQRSTEWMRFESLADFLDPADSTRTVEGYPAPRRAIVLAEAN
jgi:tRNA (mo5U34)-methyltransferase